ncbi:MAG: glycoside hydrolase family 2 protein [Prolixibacteraceae bacterium]|nr:glycoside hydrolase family 2 protein [Prolixibacteraceae bacterium]
MKGITKIVIYLVLILFIAGCNEQKSTKELFNSGWEFVISDASIDSVATAEDWEPVTLPHTPVITPKVMDGQWQGICWYRKTFNLPASAKNQRLIMRFEGAMNASEFWVNGQKVASHLGGYLPVVFDFTDVANPGGQNTILVRLDNTDNPITGPKPMHTLDFNMHGGLFRDAFLIRKNSLHITDPILAGIPAGGGIFVTYPYVSKEKATVKVQTHIKNSSNRDQSFVLINELWNDDRLVITELTSKVSLGAGKDTTLTKMLEVENPRLWSPHSPALYTLKTKVVSGGKETDAGETRIGIRHIEITEGSFKINGEDMFLRGVNRHQEYPHIGYALSNEAQYRDACKIKSAGFDYIRLSHYPHSPAFMDACDELGLVVLDAILGWQYYRRDSLFRQQIFRTAHDLVRRDRNHPCVIAWEVSLNESWMDESFIDELHRIAHAEYPSFAEATTGKAGDQCYTAGWQEYGYDIYLQARQHRLGHYKEPTKPYSVSEYGDWEYYAQNAGLNQDDWSDLKQVERSSRQLLSDGEVRLLQQATNVQEAHNDNFNTPAFSDSYWVMFDYNRGYAPDLEASGTMSIYRLPKFSYYFFQSQREASIVSEQYQSGPMVFIASYWQEGSPLDVRVFSNAEEVELFLNGVSLGRQNPDSDRISNNLAHPPFTFNIDQFDAGKLEAVAYINNEKVADHIFQTPLEPKSIELTIDESGRQPIAGVNDVVFVYAALKDKNGTTVPLNYVEVKFETEGDVKILNPETISTEAGIATALVKIGNSKDTITIKAKTESAIQSTIDFLPQ